jgi:hypothetical protein
MQGEKSLGKFIGRIYTHKKQPNNGYQIYIGMCFQFCTIRTVKVWIQQCKHHQTQRPHDSLF